MPIESVNPATGELLERFSPLSSIALEQRIALASSAFATCRAVAIEHRALWMRKLAALLESDVEELAQLITREMGKPITESRGEISKCAATCRFYAENAARFIAPEPIQTEHSSSYIRWEPLGVVLAVMPWNFPFWQVFRFLGPALMAGNVALLKHAPSVPQCALRVEELVRRAGFPRGAMQALLVETSAVEHILGDARVAAVTLTGSERAGRAIGAQAGWLIKPSVLELGGSDPFLVLPSADLALAASTGVRARTINSGQSCIAAKRFIVEDSIYDDFVAAFLEGMQRLHVGNPMDDATEVGPLASAQQLSTLQEQVVSALRAGAHLLLGGQRLPGSGFFFAPTVLESVPRSSVVYHEELFGPVAMLFRVRGLDEMIALANDTPFGLSASAWTRDPAEQQRLQAELVCGSVFFNAMSASDPRLPFGGTKRSGYGRELGSAGMRAFMNCKTVVIGASPNAASREQHARAPEERSRSLYSRAAAKGS